MSSRINNNKITEMIFIIKTRGQLKKKEEETGGSGKRATDRDHVTQGKQSAVAIKCSLNLYTYVRLFVGEKITEMWTVRHNSSIFASPTSRLKKYMAKFLKTKSHRDDKIVEKSLQPQ